MIKIIHNTIIGTGMVAIVEGLAMAARSGLDLERVHDVLSKGTCASFLLEFWIGETILKNDFNKGFYTRHMAKDLSIALDTARRLGMPLMGTAASHQIYSLASDMGLAKVDYSSILKLYTGGHVV